MQRLLEGGNRVSPLGKGPEDSIPTMQQVSHGPHFCCSTVMCLSYCALDRKNPENAHGESGFSRFCLIKDL